MVNILITSSSQYFPVFARICQYLPVFASICQYLSVFPGISRYFSVFLAVPGNKSISPLFSNPANYIMVT